MYNRLDRIPACDGLTDWRTDGRTHILPRHRPRYAYASRGKIKSLVDGHPLPVPAMLVDICKRVRKLFCSQNERETDGLTDIQTYSNDRTTPPWRSSNSHDNEVS